MDKKCNLDSVAATDDPSMFAHAYLPHHARFKFSAMHEFSFQKYVERHATLLPHRQGQRLAIAAPRGSAKSTIHTLLLPLMDIIFRRERHVVILSATQQQAANRLANITRELRNNAALHHAFFQGEPPPMQAIRRCLMINDLKVEAYGCGSEIRGISHGEYRPTHIILDDVEASRVAIVEYRRRQLLEWYDEVIENLGDTYTHITIVGTILHPKSLLSTLLSRAGYAGEIYRSIGKWNARNDLWSRWRNFYLDQSDPDREVSADNYFYQHTDEMLEGVELLWPEKESYLSLQKLYFTIGKAAFFKEKQNQPLNSGNRVFDTVRWTRFIAPEGQIQLILPPLAPTMADVGAPWDDDTDADREQCPAYLTSPSHEACQPGGLPKLSDLKYFGFLDPALGRAHTRDGDFAAIVTIGRASNGTCYVVDVWMEKARPSAQINKAFDLHQRYNYCMFGYEANGFQERLGKELNKLITERHSKGESTLLPIKPCQNMDNKRSRICMLEPPITTGIIRFQQYLPEEFFNQADDFGSPRCHDDALDALAGCYEMICRLQTGIGGLRRIRAGHSSRF